MSLGVMFVVAVLISGLMVRRFLARRVSDSQYGVAVHAVMRHIAAQGTVNRRQVQALLAVSDHDAITYLARMESDGLLRRHGHDGFRTLYTRM